VEADVLTRDGIAQHLRGGGFRVIEASNAGEAVDALGSGETVHLLFTAVNMPGVMNGIMLARWVQQNHRQIRVLLTSSQSDAGKALPGEYLFAKPYDPEEVEEYIRRVLGGA